MAGKKKTNYHDTCQENLFVENIFRDQRRQKALFLPVGLVMLFLQIGPVGAFKSLNIQKATLFITYRVQFFSTGAAVGGSLCHSSYFMSDYS